MFKDKKRTFVPILIFVLAFLLVLFLFIYLYKIIKVPAAPGSVTLSSQADWQAGTYDPEINIAVDGKMTFNSNSWVQMAASTAWAKRRQFGALVYDNKMWVMGGTDGSNYYNDVYSSTDGVAWTQATAGAAWSKRYSFGALVYDNKMWVLAGQQQVGGAAHDVYYSTNGTDWTLSTAAALWTARNGLGALVYDNKMWVMGGNGASRYNDVYWSTNGVDWTLSTAAALWSTRYNFGYAVYDNKMWVMGGYAPGAVNDVYFSSNGVDWSQATAAAGWLARTTFPALSYGGKLWVVGGAHAVTAHDVWTSTDGSSWTGSTNSDGWVMRYGHGLLEYNNRLWLLGGYNNPVDHKNDVWNFAATAKHLSAAAQIDGSADLSGWTTFEPTVTFPANTAISFRFRTSVDAASWSSWSVSYPYSPSIDISSLSSERYLQVETTLSNSDFVSTPTLSAYTANFITGTPTPSGSTLTPTPSVSGSETPTSTSTPTPTHSYFPQPTFTGDASFMQIVTFKDNWLNKEYDVFSEKEKIKTCDSTPTFVGTYLLGDKISLVIIKEDNNQYVNHDYFSPQQELDANPNHWRHQLSFKLKPGEYLAQAKFGNYDPVNPNYFSESNQVFFEIKDCSTATASPSFSTPPQDHNIFDNIFHNQTFINSLNKVNKINPFLAALILLIGFVASLLNPNSAISIYFYRLWFNLLEWWGVRQKKKPSNHLLARTILKRVRIILLILGTLIALLALLSFRDLFDLLIFIFYLLLWFLEILYNRKE